MSLWFRLRRAIAKERIKSLEHQAFLEAGKEIAPQTIKAQELRKKYGLQNWGYAADH